MLCYLYAQSHCDDGHIVQLMLHVAIISYVMHAVHPMQHEHHAIASFSGF